MSETLDKLSRRVSLIESRNRQVEADKAWEKSWARRALLVVFTYFSIAVYMYAVNLPEPWLNAIVPSVAFMLSTFTLPFFKKLWLDRRVGCFNYARFKPD